MIRSLESWRQAAARVGVPYAVVMLRWWFRNGRPTSPNRFIWNRLCRPYLNWRDHELCGRTFLGDKLTLSLRDIVQQYILYFGVWEPNLSYLLLQRLDKSGIFVDIGAHVGYFSLLASHLTKRVIAFEASPVLFRKLTRNIEENEHKNISAYNVAIIASESFVCIEPGPSANLGRTSIVACNHQSRTSPGRVRGIPLSRALDRRTLGEVRMIKIDVEGSEYPILSDLVNLHEEFSPDLEVFAEVDPCSIQKRGSSVEDILDRFRQIGFHIYEIVNDYSALPYLTRREPIPPKRLLDAPAHRADLFFSRQSIPCR
jgi:FkbM family methyltransferase